MGRGQVFLTIRRTKSQLTGLSDIEYKPVAFVRAHAWSRALLQPLRSGEQVMDTFVPFRNGQEADRPSFDVGDVLQELADNLETYGLRRGVQIEVDAPPFAMVLAEPERMRQVFLQLLTLAVDASPPGGDVIVTAYHEEDGVEVEVAEGGVEMIDPPDASAESNESQQRLAEVRRLLAAEGVELEIRDCADGSKAYLLKLGHPDAGDAESLRAA